MNERSDDNITDRAGHPLPEVRDAHDAEHHDDLKNDPSDEEAITDIAGDESFPASDPPSHTASGGGEPAPSSGYDEDAERKREKLVPNKSPMEDPGSPGGTAGTGGTSNEQDD
jgi:hypothetical protein